MPLYQLAVAIIIFHTIHAKIQWLTHCRLANGLSNLGWPQQGLAPNCVSFRCIPCVSIILGTANSLGQVFFLMETKSSLSCMWKHFLTSRQELAIRSLPPTGQSKSFGKNNTFYQSCCFRNFKKGMINQKGLTLPHDYIFFKVNISLYIEQFKLKESCCYP